MTQTYHRDRFTWLVYLLFTFYAYCLNLLGPITPFLKDELKLSYTVSSLHFTAFAVGILLIGLSGHLLIQHLGRWRSLWIGAFGMSLSALLLTFGQLPMITIGATFCMGLIGSLILVIAPAALSDWHRDQRAVALSESNMIASLVSTAAPLIVGWSAPLPGGWRLALGIAALTPIVLRLGFGNAAPPESTSNQADSISTKQPLPALYWVYWAALVLAISVEFCMIFWSADYLAKSLGMLTVNAAQAVSLFLAGMIGGRLVGSRVVNYFSTHLVIFISLGVAGAGFLMFWLTSQVIPALLGLFVTGLGVANLYPLILSLAIGAAGNNTIQAGVRATLATGTAVLTLPLVLGRLADLVGIQPAYGVVVVLLIGVFLIILITSRITSAHRAA
jgi:fucose permease